MSKDKFDSLPAASIQSVKSFTCNNTRIFQKSRGRHKILGAKGVAWRTFHTEHPNLLGETVQNLVATANWCYSSLHTCLEGPRFGPYLLLLLILLAFTTHLRVLASSFLRFRDHTHWHNPVGRTPLDEGSAPRRDLYLTTQHLQLPRSRRDTNPQSQQAIGHRPSP
jgi:hypothetical protein